MPDARLSSSLNLKGRALWFGQIELHQDSIKISGWTWTGPVEEVIPLDNVTRFKKWSTREGSNFRLSRQDKPSMRGRIESGIGLWALELEDDERVDLKRGLRE